MRQASTRTLSCTTRMTKEMYDAVQEMHSKTLSACFILVTSTSKAHPDVLFRDMVKTVMERRTSRSLLHLKIFAYQNDRVRDGVALPLELLDLKQVLMSRQWFINRLDPRGELPVT